MALLPLSLSPSPHNLSVLRPQWHFSDKLASMAKTVSQSHCLTAAAAAAAIGIDVVIAGESAFKTCVVVQCRTELVKLVPAYSCSGLSGQGKRVLKRELARDSPNFSTLSHNFTRHPSVRPSFSVLGLLRDIVDNLARRNLLRFFGRQSKLRS